MIKPIPKKLFSENNLPRGFNQRSKKTVTDKAGREWTEITDTHNLAWKIKVGLKAFFASLGTLFIGPFVSSTIRNNWLKAFSGKEVFLIPKTSHPTQTESIDQISQEKLQKETNSSKQKTKKIETTEPPKTEVTESSNASAITAPLKSAEHELVSDYGIGMVEAFGGLEQFMKIPVIDPEKWGGSFDPTQFKASIMRGKSENGAFIVFCYEPYDNFRFKGDYLLREENGSWRSGGRGIRPELTFAEQQLPANSPVIKYVLDRIERLVKGIPVGRIQTYKDSLIDYDKMAFIPQNSYLKGDDLIDFMNLSPYYYETDPANSDNQLHLYNFQ